MNIEHRIDKLEELFDKYEQEGLIDHNISQIIYRTINILKTMAAELEAINWRADHDK